MCIFERERERQRDIRLTTIQIPARDFIEPLLLIVHNFIDVRYSFVHGQAQLADLYSEFNHILSELQ